MPQEVALHGLTQLEERFCEEFIYDLDASAAAQRAGYRYETEGPRLLTRRSIQRRIEELKNRRATRLELTADDVLKRWWLLATTDTNDLVQIRRVNCRYCHGKNHEYQWTPAEYDAALLKHAYEVKRAARRDEEPPLAPNDNGGIDFNPWREPSDQCPECYGVGEERAYITDTRHLSPGAKALFAGVDVANNGRLKLKLYDREAALLAVAKHLGMHVERHQHSGPNGEPLTVEVRVVRPPIEIDGDVTDAIEHS